MATDTPPSSSRELSPLGPGGPAGGTLVPAGGDRWPVAPREAPAMPGFFTTLRLLRRRWLLACVAGPAGALLAAAAVWFGMPAAKYTARVLLYIPANAPSVVAPVQDGRNDPLLYQQAQATLIKSRFVLNAALDRTEVRELNIVRERSDPVAWLQQELKTTNATSPEFLRVTLTGDRPEEMRVLVDAVAEAYLREVVDKERGQRMRRLAQLTEIQEKFEATLRRKRDLVRNRTLAVGASDPQVIAVKQRFAFEALGMAERELLQRKSELREINLGLKGKQDKERQAVIQDAPTAVIEEALARDPDAAKLKQELARLEEVIAEGERVSARPREAAGFKRFYRDRDTLRASLDALRDRLRPRLVEEWRERSRQAAGDAVALLRERQKYLGELVGELESEVERLRAQTSSLNSGSLDIESNKAEIGRVERVADRVSSEADSLRLELDAPPRVSRLEPADVSQEDDLRRRSRATGVAAFVGLCLALGMVSYREFHHRRVDGPDEMVAELGLPLMGALPALPGPRGGPARLAGPGEQAESFEDCVDAARARLIFAGRERGVRVVMVTSAVGGEGKTTLAAHLAVSLARAGRKTVLVDADARRPAVHRIFGLPPAPGFCELLRGEVQAADAVRPTDVEGLWVLPAGRGDGASSRALAREGDRDILSSLRAGFDFVIVDSAPVLPLVDSLLLAQRVDGVILSALRLVSQLPAVQAARQRLVDVGVPVLGLVLAGARSSNYGYRYPADYGESPAEPVPAAVPGAPA